MSYSGELAYEVYIPAGYAHFVWQALMKEGERLNLRPYGTEAMGALRIEKGHVAGPELDGRTTMRDLRMDGFASRKKPFVGSVLKNRPLLTDPSRPSLVGLEIEGNKEALAGSLLFTGQGPTEGHGDGWVSSTTYSPALGKIIALVLSEKQPGGLAQLAGWQDFAEASEPALTALGFEGLGDYRTVRTADKASCFRIAPDKLLLRHQNSVVLHAALEKLDSACSPTLDLSHARWLIEIEGTEVEALLARLAPLDFTLSEFPQGTFAQTGIHHVGVLLHRVSMEKFEIFVPVSWVVSLSNLICETAAPFAYRVETTQF